MNSIVLVSKKEGDVKWKQRDRKGWYEWGLVRDSTIAFGAWQKQKPFKGRGPKESDFHLS